MLLIPVIHRRAIPTHMRRVEIRRWPRKMRPPIVREQRSVSRTQELLPQDIRTMVEMNPDLTGRIIGSEFDHSGVCGPRMLPQHELGKLAREPI